jgi:photosystem II stability/assembly factor-like uncharacterized protein
MNRFFLHLICLFTVCFTCGAPLFGQDPYTDPDYEFYWEKGLLNLPTPAEHSYDFYDDMIYLDIFFLDDQPNIGWACGFNSVILKTTDAGVNWDVIDIDRQIINEHSNGSTTGNLAQFETIQFLNENVGYVSGPLDGSDLRGCIYKSDDGGLTWRDITPPAHDGTNLSLWGFHFYDENRGVLLGQGAGFVGTCEFNRVYTTTDGGRTWNFVDMSILNIKLSDPLFIDRDRVLLIGGSRIFEMDFDLVHLDLGLPRIISRTTDGIDQETFDWHEEIDVINNTILIPSSTGCHGSRTEGQIRWSSDFGRSWFQVRTPGPNYGSFLIDESIGWIAGQVNGAYYTTDAGITWQEVGCGIDDPADGDDIYFTDRTTGYLAANGVYKLMFGTLEEQIPDTINIVKCAGGDTLIGNPMTIGNVIWNTGARSQTIRVTEPGVYTRRNTYPNTPSASNPYCDQTDVVVYNITSFEKPATDFTVLPDKRDHCEGDIVEISFTGDTDFIEWLDNGNTDPNRVITQTGSYIAVSEDNRGCIFYDTLALTFHSFPEVNLTALTELDFCQGFEGFVEATPGYASYQWLRDGEPWENSMGNLVTITETGYYSVIVENEYGCATLSDSVYSNVRQDSNRLAISPGDRFDYFGMIESGLTNCITYELINTGTADYTVEEIYFYRNVEFTFPSAQFPVTIPGSGSIDVTVCYSPYAMHDTTDRDTMYLSDQCTPHELLAEGDPLIFGYSDETECETELTMRGVNSEDVILFERVISIYPNPTEGSVRLDVILRSEAPLDQFGRFFLYSSEGQPLSPIVPTIIESTESSGYFYATIEFDLIDFPSGMYFIRDIFGEISGQIILEK